MNTPRFESTTKGGAPLSVFHLAAATFAEEGFKLCDDWLGIDSPQSPA